MVGAVERNDDEENGTTPINLRLSKYLAVDEIKSSDNIRILSFNAQSMNNKFQKIRDITQHIKPIAVAIQETWGKNHTTDYSIRGYHKPEICTRKGNMNAGGGVGLWIREDTDFESIKSPFVDKLIETQTILLPDLNIILINVYRPFGDKDIFLKRFLEHILEVKKTEPHMDIVIVGDLNIDLLQDNEHRDKLIEHTVSAGFIQQVTLPTRTTTSSKSLIDHVFTKSKKTLYTDVIQSDLSDHYLTLTTYPNYSSKKEKLKITKRWLTFDSYAQVRQLLSAEKWDSMESMNLEESTSYLSEKIKESLDIVAPVETKIQGKRPINLWTTGGIKVSLKKCTKLYRVYKKSPNENSKKEYKVYKKLLDKLIRLVKSDYYDVIIEEVGNDTRKLWGILNELIDRKQCRHKMPNRFVIDGQSVRNKKNIANAFNVYFSSIGTEMADQLPEVAGYEEYLEKHPVSKFQLKPLEEEEVVKIMKNPQPKRSCGTDTIDNKVVKTCHQELGIPMTHIINKSIKEGKVPLLYKQARIIPLYKKGAANTCGNYRPVSLLSALSKILEKAVCGQLIRYLDDYNLLCDQQFGFRPKNQTTHVVQHMMNVITDASVQDRVTIATYIDLSKAFDCLQYDKLFQKMVSLGFQDNTLNWFKDYLTDRRQCVDIDGEQSEWLDVKLGVPQGSILGPILFLIYVNDINKCNKHADYAKFADDTTILTSCLLYTSPSPRD